MIRLIVGTNRPGSNTRRVCDHIAEIYRELHEPLEVIDLAKLPPEIFDPVSYEDKPPAFTSFADAVVDSSGLIVVTPEYNGSLPGILKYFIDMLPFPESFEERPVCFVGLSAGMWGALRPVEQLQQIFGYRNAYCFPTRVFMPGIHNVLDEHGQFTDLKVRDRLKHQAEGFVDFVKKLKTQS